MFTDSFVRRPVMAIVCSLVVMLVGAVSATGLGVQETPQIESPVVTVSTTYPGADPAIVETEVTEPIEREINGIAGLRTLTSESRDQTSRITAEFELGIDLEAAANDVRDRVSRARKRLPEDVEEPTVEKSDADAAAVMYMRLMGDRSLLELSEVADTIVRERVQRVSGVSRVDIMGERRYAMRIELDPDALAARGLVLADIDAALVAGNVRAPAGRVEGLVTDVSMRVDGGLSTPEAFEALPVATRDGAMVRLGDVARVRLGAEQERSSARADGVPSVSLAVVPQAGANIVAISDEVRERLDGIRADLPDGVQILVNYDRSLPVRVGLKDVVFTLLMSTGIVVLVIGVFFRDVRATVVPTVAIFVSLLGTFAFLAMAGFTINVFTLFALVLSIGIVVDDAIVVLENVQRHLELGASPLDAALLGTREIVVPVIATTVSLLVVFLPIVFVGGTTGRLFLEFGSTVAVSVALSGFVALTLSPALCGLLLRPSSGGSHDHEDGALQRAFARTLDLWWRAPALSLVAIVVSLAAGGWALYSAPRDFFPIEDRNLFIVRLTAPEGVGFPWMDARVAEIEPMLMEAVPERTTLMSRVATVMGGGAGGAANTGMVSLALVGPEERERSQQEIVDAVRKLLSDVTAFRVTPIQLPTVGRGFGSPVQVVIQHDDFEAIVAELPSFLEKVRALPGLSGVDADLRLDRPEARVIVDRDAALRLGVGLDAIAQTLQVLTSGLERARFDRGVRQYPVLVSVVASERSTTEELGRLRVRASSGALIPLASLVRFEEHSAPSSRFHYDRSPSATISANLDGIALGEGIARVQALAEQELPSDFRTALAGQSKDFGDANQGLAVVFGLAVTLVFLVLAAQFDTFGDPVPILVSVPVAVAGGLGALALTGEALTFFGQVGLVLLVGLVTKNGILIVEFARHAMSEGDDVRTAARRAAILRLRPILMTAASTVGGAVPIALGYSGESRASLGVVVCAGMTLATVLSLYVTPVVWTWVVRRPATNTSKLIAGATAMLLAVAAPRAEASDWTLDAVVERALSGDPDVVAAQAAEDAAREATWIAGGSALPSVDVSGRIQYGNTTSAAAGIRSSAFSPFASTSATLEVPIADGAGWAAWFAARRAVDAAGSRTDAAAQAAAAEVAGLWVDLSGAQSRLAAREQATALASRLAAAAEQRVTVGVAVPIERVRAELVLRQAELAVIAARRDRDAAAAALAARLALPDGDVPVATDADLPAVVVEAEALDARPDVVAARKDLATAQADRVAARWAFAPRLAGFGTVGAQDRFDADGWRSVVAVGGNLTLSALDAPSVARLRQREDQVRQAEARLDGVRRDAAAQLGQARAADDAAGAVVDVARAALALADQEVAQAEQRWSVGAIDQTAVVDAQVRRVEAAVALADAEAAAARAAVALRWAAGKLGR